MTCALPNSGGIRRSAHTRCLWERKGDIIQAAGGDMAAGVMAVAVRHGHACDVWGEGMFNEDIKQPIIHYLSLLWIFRAQGDEKQFCSEGILARSLASQLMTQPFLLT